MFGLTLHSRFSVFTLAVLLLTPFLFLLGLAAISFFEDRGTLIHLVSTSLPSILLQTVLLCMGVILLTSTMGVLTAWWVCAYEFIGRRYLEWLLLLPMAMPSYVIAYAYTDALQYSGWVATLIRQLLPAELNWPDIRSTGGAVLVLSFVLYPYVYIMARTAFLNRSPSMLDAARSLGHGPISAFLRIGLLTARPAWVVGLALVIMETLAEYGALSYFGVQTFTTAIYKSWLNLGDRQAAILLSVILLAFMLILIVIESNARGRAQYYSQNNPSRHNVRKVLQGQHAAFIFVLTSLPLLLGFILPVLFLLVLLAGVDFPLSVSRSLTWAWHSGVLGVIAATVSLCLAIFLSYVKRQSISHFVKAVHRIVSLGYGVPGAILTIGILLPLSRFDQLIYQLGWVWFPALTGSVYALIYAYNVRFTSAAIQSVDAGLQQITRHIDESARVLGRSARQVLLHVHLPILKSSLATGFLLVIVDVVKELPVTLVLRPFDFDTLAVSAYQFALDERLGEAALPALLIVLVALIPIVLLIRQDKIN